MSSFSRSLKNLDESQEGRGWFLAVKDAHGGLRGTTGERRRRAHLSEQRKRRIVSEQEAHFFFVFVPTSSTLSTRLLAYQGHLLSPIDPVAGRCSLRTKRVELHLLCATMSASSCYSVRGRPTLTSKAAFDHRRSMPKAQTPESPAASPASRRRRIEILRAVGGRGGSGGGPDYWLERIKQGNECRGAGQQKEKRWTERNTGARRSTPLN